MIKPENNPELLQEWLLDLLRRNEQISQREMHATALLEIIQAIGQAENIDAVIGTLLQGLQIITGHEEYALLEAKSEGCDCWLATRASCSTLEQSIWQKNAVFERALQGECIVLFRPQCIAEFQEQDGDVLDLATSALIFSLQMKKGHHLLLLMHRQSNVFSNQQKEAVGQLKPIAEQRIQNIELEQKLYELVTQRTDALHLSQRRMNSFVSISSDWFWELDKDLCLCYSFGYQKTKPEGFYAALMGKHWLELRSEQEKLRLNKWFGLSRIIQRRGEIKDFEFELQAMGYDSLSLRVNGAPFFDEQGHFEGYSGTATNISHLVDERLLLNQQIQQMTSVKAQPEDTANTIFTPEAALKVLLVDDCKSSQMITQLMLINLGYATKVVENGQQALALDDLKDYAVILMDLDMPDMKGEDVCLAMRARGISSPIIALTGYRFDDRAEQAEAAGMNDFIEKPVRLNLLKEHLEKAIS